jgi:hypothetical protein
MTAACAAVGANAPNGAGEGSLSGIKFHALGKKRYCIAGFERGSNVARGALIDSIGRHAPPPGLSASTATIDLARSGINRRLLIKTGILFESFFHQADCT